MKQTDFSGKNGWMCSIIVLHTSIHCFPNERLKFFLSKFMYLKPFSFRLFYVMMFGWSCLVRFRIQHEDMKLTSDSSYFGSVSATKFQTNLNVKNTHTRQNKCCRLKRCVSKQSSAVYFLLINQNKMFRSFNNPLIYYFVVKVLKTDTHFYYWNWLW